LAQKGKGRKEGIARAILIQVYCLKQLKASWTNLFLFMWPLSLGHLHNRTSLWSVV